jgi:DnaJ family protein B protein 4
MRWHPDKNRDNLAESQQKFQEVSEAYDVLSDPHKRSIFDQYGYDALRNGITDENGESREGYAFNDRAAEQVFSKFFGTSNPFYDFGFGNTLPFASSLRKKGVEKADPITSSIECTLEELFNGAIKTILIKRTRLQKDEIVEDTKTFTLKIKPGWKHGTKITFEHEGNETRARAAGDIVFTISEIKHAFFSRDGSNLIFTAKLKLSEALTDYCIEVPTLDGRKIAIPCNEIVTPTSQKVIKGEGMPKINTSSVEKGDLIVKFDIIFPRHLTALQKSALVKILG